MDEGQGATQDVGDRDGLPPLSPDDVEQDQADEIDDIVPTRGYRMTPMVGLGGSAGGIPALMEFFKAAPPDSGMAYAVVLHLSPTHESTLPALLGNVTTMPVLAAADGQEIAPDHVYVIPPGRYLSVADGHLRLAPMEPERGKRVAVDVFFRSLADTHGPHATAIVLSGADGDGAQGLKRIKERGGLTIVQDPDQAEHPGMPRSAIETGMVDWVLDVGQMPSKIAAYQANARRLSLPPEEGPPPPPAADDREAALGDVLSFLRMRTGRDFSCYKRATVLRRIGRRMQVNGVDDLSAYLGVLRTHPGEAGALLQDLLISVTNFFRDRDDFAALEAQIPQLFRGKSQGDTVRVWCSACATGEEAYSLAMLLLEHAGTMPTPPAVQVFACDLDDAAVQKARLGQYPHAIEADVSEERLRRFFVRDDKGYRIRRDVRETVLFAVHDLLRDPPFSRIDLVSCRNLLIYLNREAQGRALDIFHFALRPGGLMFLGSSESVDEESPLFRVVDKKSRIYARRPAPSGRVPSPPAADTPARAVEAPEQARSAPVVHGRHFASGAAALLPGPALDRASLAELHLRLVERSAPPSVLVDAEHEIVHVSERAGEFLRVAAGEPTTNLLKVVHADLRTDLRAALYRAVETDRPTRTPGVPAGLHGGTCRVRIGVAPAADVGAGLLLVTFEKEDAEAGPPRPEDATPAPPEPLVRHLEREIERIKADLRDTVEQYEASTEELKASNEELQAMNEELRAATEELETGREELQSINEELATVNHELKGKVEEVAGINSDLQNLMASTAIATVFLDRDLAIKLFTPAAAEIFHMIPGDVGRPLAHLRHRLDYPGLLADAGEVLRTLVPVEREVRAEDRWYLVRLQPYRTVEDQIAGVVLTLVDVSERLKAVEALRRSQERLRLLVESAKDYAIFTIDPDRRVDSWNPGAENLFGYAEREILGRSGDILFTPEDRAKGDAEGEARRAAERGRAENERWHARKDGSIFYGSGLVMPLRDGSGGLLGFAKIMRDLTERKRTQEALQEHIDELGRFNVVAVGRETRMIELKAEINDLCRRLNEPERYSPDGPPGAGPT